MRRPRPWVLVLNSACLRSRRVNGCFFRPPEIRVAAKTLKHPLSHRMRVMSLGACRRIRSGFERLVLRLDCVRLHRRYTPISPASPSLPVTKPLALGPTTGLSDTLLFIVERPASAPRAIHRPCGFRTGPDQRVDVFPAPQGPCHNTVAPRPRRLRPDPGPQTHPV